MLREILTALSVLLFASAHSDRPTQNRPPIANADTYTVHGFMSPLSPQVTANDFDPDGDPIFVTGVLATTQHGGLSRLTGDDFSYRPALGYVGPDSFTYQVCDNMGACSSAVVSFNVVNEPPTASNDSYFVHGLTTIGPLLANDSDPDGDALIFSGFVLFPEHGTLSGLTSDTFLYRPDAHFIGVDTFTYKVCDEYQLCSVATVFLNVNNNPPVAVGESYTAHGPTTIGPLLENDYDPDGDQLRYSQVTGASHGTVFGLTQSDVKSYVPDYGYIGPDSFTYKVCDEYFACSEPVEVLLNVVNDPPIAGDDHYVINGTTTIGPLRLNDSDPEGDTLGEPALIVAPQHGTVFGLSDPDLKSYVPGDSFSGFDSFVYQICDHLGACSTATVTLSVQSEDDAENFGEVCPNQRVGGPINVTNGNMYLQQEDYKLPGVGVPIYILRTYNSMSQRFGIFGRGWSTIFDESLSIQGLNSLRLHAADGRATNFRRGDNGVFLPVEGDFHGHISMNIDGTLSLSHKSGGVDLFNNSGKLLNKTDRYGNQTSLIYDNNRLTAVIDATGRTVTFSLNGNGYVRQAEDQLGTIATYEYGVNNELLSVTYPDGSGYQFSYVTSPHILLGTVKDMLGNILEAHTYDELGRAISFEKHGGVERVILDYVDASRTDVTDSLGRVTRYFSDKSGGRNVVRHVEGACNCSGGAETKSWTHDSHLNILSFSNSANQTIHYTYDSDGNELTMTDLLGTSSMTYNHRGQVLTSTDVMGAVTTGTYDAQGNLLSLTDAQNNTTSFTYDSRGLLLTMTDALSNVTRFTYDTHGNLIEKIDQLGSVTRFVYDGRGRLASAQDSLTNTATYSYDAAGRLNKITRADGSTVSLEHDLAGRLKEVIDSRNNSTKFEYDNAYRLISRTNAMGSVKRFFYDAASNLVAQSNELGHIIDFEYDHLDRLAKIIYPAATAGQPRLEETITYDTLGNVVKHSDRLGRVTSFEYDHANRLTGVTDPELRITRYEYNPRSNLVAVVDPLNQLYGFEYDNRGRTTKVTRAGLAMSFTYEAVGNRSSRIDFNGRTTTYAYDELNRLTTTNYPDGSTTSYAYDALSRLVRASNVNGTVSFAYDRVGRVLKTVDALGQVINYTYDANGNRLRMIPGSGPAIAYQYDSLNRVSRIIDGEGQAVTYSYDAASKLTARLLPNDVATHYEYDRLGRLTRLKETKAKKVLADSQYSYDAMANIVQIVDSTFSRHYAYDDDDRLVSVTNPRSSNEFYSYDGVGNRTSSHLSSIYQYQPLNRLVATSAASYLYDGNGNLLSRADGSGTTQFKWDFEDRLVQAVVPSRVTVNYSYDALGRLIQRTTTGGFTTNFQLDGDDVIRDRHSLGATTEYLNGPGIDNKIGQKNILGSFYFMQDHLGSIVGLTDKKGKVVEQVSYDSFGNGTGSSLTHYGFTGRERDPVTGLFYYRARWYDAQLGRFISEDPIGLGGGINSYAYVGNNPVKRKDPWGMYEIDVHYYLTYFLAVKNGCFSDAEARLIAEANQGTDEIHNTRPGPGINSLRRRQNREYHALHKGSREGQGSPSLWLEAMRGPTNLVGLGRYLHYLQDTFSHSGYESDTYGHLFALHYYDKTNSDVPRAIRMAGATWKALNDYTKAKKCGCVGRWEYSWWEQVIAFSHESGANFGALETIDSAGELDNFGMRNHPLYLLRKIRILGLPLR